jgi:TfoX/Sxy family transcriptional regulator of competence genes
MAYDEFLADRIRSALRERSDVVEKRMFGGVAFMVHGHMSCGVVGTSLMVRLEPDEADRLLRTPDVRVMDFSGRPMRGFLYVDPPGVATGAQLRIWVERAAAFAESRPAKKTTAAASRTSPARKSPVRKRPK